MSEKNLDFDTPIERRGTDCLKYDFAVRRGMPEDVLPLWVADMDFKTSSYIEDALIERVKHGIFGYSDTQSDYFASVRAWMERHHGWSPEEAWLIKTPGVVFALAMAVRACSKPGDAVLIQQPVYYPFSEVIRDNGRVIVSSDLKLGDDSRYHIDFEDFEHKIIEHDVRLFLLCNPHNPTGRVFTVEELTQLGDICLRHGVTVVSDEIHSDFVFKGRHTVFASVKPEFADISVICTAPSKTFNLAGMLISHIFIPNTELRDSFKAEVNAAGISQLSPLGLTAARAAYDNGEAWYRAVHNYIRANIQFVREYALRYLPSVNVIDSEGTYLVWLDFRGTGINAAELDRRIIHDAGLWLDSGRIFGDSGSGFQRINAATTRAVLTECLNRLRNII